MQFHSGAITKTYELSSKLLKVVYRIIEVTIEVI